MDDVRAQRVAKARAILNSSTFQSRTVEEKRRIVRIMVEKGLRLDDLQMLKDELVANGRMTAKPTTAIGAGEKINTVIREKFAFLDKGPLEIILSNLPPRDILLMCQSNKLYAHICQNPQVFHRLLDRHYPQAVHTTDPRRQYVALTQGIQTSYRIAYTKDTTLAESIRNGERPVQVGVSQRPEDFPNWSLANVDRDIVNGFTNNRFFLNWISPEQRQQLEALKTTSWTPFRNFAVVVAAEYRLPFIHFFDDLFKAFAREYHRRGLAALGQSILEKLSLDESPVGKLVVSDFKFSLLPDELKRLEGDINAVLEYGKRKLQTPNQFSFIVKGLAIPPGTIAWCLTVDFTFSKILIVFKNREGAVESLVNRFDRLFATVMSDFGRYITFTPGLADLRNMKETDQADAVAFKEWLNGKYPGMTSFTKDSLRQYLSQPEVTTIFDYDILPLHF